MREIKIHRPELEYSENEAYKSLRTNLLFCGEEKKVIAITSSTPNEGKKIDKAYITVTIGGSALAQDKFTFESNKLTINDSDVTGDVVITVVAK